MTVHYLPGAAALPEFRLAKTLVALRRKHPAITELFAWSAYFVDAAVPLDDDELSALGRLLDPSIRTAPHSGARAPPDPADALRVLVIPREGTISGWSSKATDIAGNCGFARVRRVERGTLWLVSGSPGVAASALEPLYDRMTERLLPVADAAPNAPRLEALEELAAPAGMFGDTRARPLVRISLRSDPELTLRDADRRLGLALNDDEVQWLCERFAALRRAPTDAELMMFAQANSEHCRHKIFNAAWTVDGRPSELSLFDMIRHTHAVNPGRVLSAYRDNSAVVDGGCPAWFGPDPETGDYRHVREPAGLLMKVETHNHPTAVSPFAGAATGSGGEIRDEAATGRGAGSRAGLVGFSVSALRIPGFEQPWEADGPGAAPHLASALEIMLDAPVGAARFNNEFGRPALGGYFRSFEQPRDAGGGDWYGYHKPIMIAGGMGRVRRRHVAKDALRPGMLIGVLGGPAMLIGLGGGAASSGSGSGMDPIAARPGQDPSAPRAGSPEAFDEDVRRRRPGSAGDEPIGDDGGRHRQEIDRAGHDSSKAGDDHHRRELDFRSVQRDNAEMQRRAQEVIDSCARLADRNPIRSIHDVGAGGLANAVPELVHADGLGARLALRAIPTADPGMSPMEIWCNEAQERYVIAFDPDDRPRIESFCRRERCPFAVIGTVTEEPHLTLEDEGGDGPAVDVPVDLVLGGTPRLAREARHGPVSARMELELPGGTDVPAALQRVLRLPCVADKSFLVTIGDRSVSGLVARDQMVGPWQVPVADCAVTAADHCGFAGEAMAVGERAPVAVLDPAASARMAIGEALTNVAAAGIGSLSEAVLSANWMADAGRDDTALHDAVRAAALELCPELGVPIPVGKDSLSMRTAWREGSRERVVSAPLSLVASAFAPVADVRRALTPVLAKDSGNRLVLVDLGLGRGRLGGSALAQVCCAPGGEPPDADAGVLKGFFDSFQSLVEDGLVLAYHDRSDGGLAVTVCEMAFAGRAGVRIDLTPLGPDPMRVLFCEELGAVLQVHGRDAAAVLERLRAVPRLASHVHAIGEACTGSRIRFEHRGTTILDTARVDLHRAWSQTSYRMQALRDDPQCAREAFDALLDDTDPGLGASLTFPYGTSSRAGAAAGAATPCTATKPSKPRAHRPRVAILREQGVNGHLELAAAFDRAGFDAVDLHMSDLIDGRQSLAPFAGLAAGGGFSYGDVLGAGGGWAATVLHRHDLRETFREFFRRPDTFSLGVCNGCQMLARLRSLIPGADDWPRFAPNRSGQFEARLVMCEILDSPSIFFRGMAGSKLPVVVAHGEGRAVPATGARAPCLRFVDNRHRPAERYPANPNGSPGGLTGFTSRDGRATVLMPHPERTFRTVQLSWHPPDWSEESPWMEMFRNALRWCTRG
ncbi:MAG: phosphoribosylformylglycinamidine synthase [Immundisolibacterales bacterium]|nr:phosphoribosylformylglycinamidine synthase [Immundisolibacterales bacterium]